MTTKDNNSGRTGRRIIQLDDDILREITQHNTAHTKVSCANDSSDITPCGESDEIQSQVTADKVTITTDVNSATNVTEIAKPIEKPVSIPRSSGAVTDASIHENPKGDEDKGATRVSIFNATKRMADAIGKAMAEDKNENITASAKTRVNKVTDVTDIGQNGAKTPEPIKRKATSPPRATRVSFKMREATRKGFCEDYTHKVDTKSGKPITIAPDLLERLQTLCILSGDFKSCPTYIINNLISVFLDIVEPEAKKWGTPN